MASIKLGRPVVLNDCWRFVEYDSENDDELELVGWCKQDDGHSTEAEARTCYQDYRITNIIDLVDNDPLARSKVPNQKCGVCGTETNGYLSEFGYHLANVCVRHADKESVKSLLGPLAPNYRYEMWKRTTVRDETGRRQQV